MNWLDSIAWWGLGPVGGPNQVLSQVGLQCFPAALDEWTSENWLVSGGGGHRPEAGAAATHCYAMQGPGHRLEVYGFRVVSESAAGAKETANQPATSPARTPAAGKLEFRVAPYHPSKVKNPTVNESNVKYYLELLKGGEIEKTPAHWFLPIHGEAKGYDDLITAEHEGRTYLLVCRVPGQTMRAEENGKDAWGLESAYKTKDENGKWTIGFRFDGNGSRRFGELTKANVGSALAIVIGGEVMAAPIIREPSVECPVITGRFSDEEARDLVTALKAAMPPATQSGTATSQATDGRAPGRLSFFATDTKNWETPFRIEFGKSAKWTEGHAGFDPDLPGYHVTGEIASIVLNPTGHNLPRTFVLAITTSPGQRPMLEAFKVSTSDKEIDTAMFDGTDYESIGHKATGVTERAKKGTHFKFEVVDKEVRVTFVPEAMSLLRGKCTVSWIDWYRR